MVATEVLKVRVPPDTKQSVRALAQQQQLTESALLMRLVQTMLQTSGATRATTFDPLQPVARGARLYVRLRAEDHVLLRERALVQLKRSVSELGAIGRNLNQLARVANQTGRVTGPSLQDLHALLRVCTALRDHIKELINSNTASWNTGHAEARR